MSDDHAGGNSGIGRDGFVSGIAGDDAAMGMAYHARDDHSRGLVTVLRGKLCQTGCVVVDDGSGRNAVQEFGVLEPAIRE